MTIYAPKFIPFFGKVEDVNDPLKQGRVRVRVFGYHTDNQALIPTEMLPWFSSVVSNSAGVHGVGDSPTGYALDSTVFGYFLDKTYQTGIVVGALTGSTGGTNDLSGLAIQNPNHRLYDFRNRNAIKKIPESEPKKSWQEPEYVNNSQYPYNQVFESAGGLVREMDSTPGHERIHEYHPSGTYYEVREDGTRVVKVIGDGYELIAGDKFINVRGNVNVTYDGNVNEYIKGDYKRVIAGNKEDIVLGEVFESYGEQNTQVLGDKILNAETVIENANETLINSASPEFEEVEVTVDEAYDIEFVRTTLDQAGRHAEFDEPSTIPYTPSDYPQDVPPSSYDGEVKEDAGEVGDAKETPKTENLIQVPDRFDHSIRLSDNYTVADLSTRTLYPHDVRAQAGYTLEEIVWNMQALAQNILEPIRKEFGPFRINSGFRPGNGKSQHERGMAVDIQEPTWSNKKRYEVGLWVIENLPFDQIICEHGNSVWLHISFDRTKSRQRGSTLTMIGKKYHSGFKLYY